MADLTVFDEGGSVIALRANSERGVAFMERFYGEVLSVNRHNEYMVPRLMEAEVRQAARFRGVTVEDHHANRS